MQASDSRGVGISSTLRRAQTLRELARLEDELIAWDRHRHLTDCDGAGVYRGQFETQREAVVTEVKGAIAAVREEVSRLSSASLSPMELYPRLARSDRQVIWIRQAWDFYRSRFDQRDAPELAATLKAADEVSWSCFKPLFRKGADRRPPAPLPCIEPDYTPSTLLSTHAHVLARPGDATAGPLQGYFDTLPVPLLRLPPSVVTCPWNLVLIGHEVGHVVYAQINPNGSFPDEFRSSVAAAARRAGGDEAVSQHWSRWAAEIFADCYAVLMMGPWSIWALGQLELGSAAQMAAPRPFYPPATLRLILLAQMATRLGLGQLAGVLGALGMESADTAALLPDQRLQVAIASEVSQLAAAVLPGRRATLAQAVAFRLSDFQAGAESPKGMVAEWSEALLGEREKVDENDLRTARLVAAGVAQAAFTLGGLASPDGAERLEPLRSAALQRIAACGEAGTRSAVSVAAPLSGVGLARRLLDATDDDLLIH